MPAPADVGLNMDDKGYDTLDWVNATQILTNTDFGEG
jgi:hypothetical protein